MARFFESPHWRQIICDRQTHETLAFLDTVNTNRILDVTLDTGHVFSGSVAADNPRVSIAYDGDGFNDPFLAEGTRLFHGFRAEDPTGLIPYKCRFSGIYLAVTDRADADRPVTDFIAYDPWQYLYLRPVTKLIASDYTLLTRDGIDFEDGVRIDQIVTQLLLDTINAHGPCMIDAGEAFGGTNFWDGEIEELDELAAVGGTGKPAWNIAQGTSVGQAWTDLAQLPGCDIVLTPIYDPINRPGYCAELSVFRSAGSFRANAVMGWDGPVNSAVEISRFQDGTQRANKIAFYSGQGGPPAHGSPLIDATSVDKYGEYWAQQWLVRQTKNEAVAKLAQQALAMRKNGLKSYTLKPAAEWGPVALTDYGPGDTVPVNAGPSLRGGFDDVARIYGMRLNISDDQLEVVDPVLASPDLGDSGAS